MRNISGTALDVTRQTWGAKRMEWTEQANKGWVKLTATSADIVLLFKPDGGLHSQRNKKQDAEMSAKKQGEQS